MIGADECRIAIVVDFAEINWNTYLVDKRFAKTQDGEMISTQKHALRTYDRGGPWSTLRISALITPIYAHIHFAVWGFSSLAGKGRRFYSAKSPHSWLSLNGAIGAHDL